MSLHGRSGKSINSMSERMIKGALHPVGIASCYAARNLSHTVCTNPSGPRRIQPSQQRKRYMEWKQRAAQRGRHILLLPRCEPDQRNFLFGRSFRRHELPTCLEHPPPSLERMVYRLL